MGSEAIYHLKSERPKRARTQTGDQETVHPPFEAEDDVCVAALEDADSSDRLPRMMLSASGKAVRDTRRALKRTTKMLYRSLQKELPALFERAESDPSEQTEADADSAIPTAIARRAARGGELEYLPGWTMNVPLNDGTHVTLRPLLPEDKERLEEAFERLSAESRYQRFMTAMETLPDAYLNYLTEIDHVHHFAVAAAIEDPARFDMRGLGVARFIELPDIEDEAELAITIVDEAQGQGLGHILMEVLLLAAAERGFVALRAEVLPSNLGMQKLARRFGGERVELHDGMTTWRIPVPNPKIIADSPDEATP